MKKPIFHFENESYKAFEDYLFTFMPVNKCKDIYVIINCMEDLYDHIQINGQIQKTCSPETPAYTIVRNIMYWYIDWVDEIENFLYDNCNCYDMTIQEEEVRYEKILKTLKKYTARKNQELNNFFGGNDMKKHIFESDQESFEQMTFDNPKIWYDYVTKKYFLGEIGTFNKLIKTVRDLGVYKYDRKTGFYKVPFETDIGVNVMDFSYDPTDYEPLDPFIKSVMHEIGGKVVYAIDYPEDYLSCDEFMHIINDMERIQEFLPFDFDSEEKFAYVIKDVPEESTSKAAENVEKIEKYEQNHQELISPEPITDVKDVTRESLLDGAKKCVCSDRNKQYGSPEDNFGIIARYWKEYLGVDITAMDVGIMMTMFKIGRMQSGGYKPDNFVDAIGYLACAGECGAKEEES